MWIGPLLLSSSIYKYICRTGLIARAVVYWLIAGLMLKAALLPGELENGMGPTEAFLSLETTQAGRLFLLSIGVGLMLYAGWRWTQAIFDVRSEGEDASGYLARGGMAMSVLSYASVAIAAIAVTLGANAGGGPGMTEQALRWLLTMPFGRILVVLPGLIFIAIAGTQIWRAFDGRWSDDLAGNDWLDRARPVVSFAIGGRGLLFGLVGVFAVLGGLAGDPSDAHGLAETLGWLREQAFGFWLYLTGAAIIGSYGVYSALQAALLKFRC